MDRLFAPLLAQIPMLSRLLKLWRERVGSRNELRRMSARELADIGQSDYDRRQECAKPFWQA